MGVASRGMILGKAKHAPLETSPTTHVVECKNKMLMFPLLI